MTNCTFNKKMLVLTLLMALTALILTGCASKTTAASSLTGTPSPAAEKPFKEKGPKPTVTIEMADGGKIVLELYPSAAPNTVKNFIALSKKGFYDGLTFHRIIKDFMIQGGDPDGKGTGGPGYGIKGEFADNGVKNSLKHTAGVISMARSQENDSAGSQFFIMHADVTQLDGKYAAFGKVIKGMDVVNKIATTKVIGEQPEKPVVIKKMTIKLNGYVAKAPEIIK